MSHLLHKLVKNIADFITFVANSIGDRVDNFIQSRQNKAWLKRLNRRYDRVFITYSTGEAQGPSGNPHFFDLVGVTALGDTRLLSRAYSCDKWEAAGVTDKDYDFEWETQSSRR